MSKFKERYLVFLVMICFIVIGLYYSYAIFVTKQLQENVVSLKTVSSNVKLSINNDNKVTIRPLTEESIAINLKNESTINYFYEIYFISDQGNIMVYSDSDDIKSNINGNEEKLINVNIDNHNEEEVLIEFVVKTSISDDILKENGYRYINKEKNYDHTHANKPDFSNTNLVPVAYKKINDKDGFWYKIDASNNSDLYYSYDNGIWANAVLVKNDYYQINDKIEIGDILGFYVWIPRFKYTILNNSNYTNFERMNNVFFESDNSTTGTINCYDKISNLDDNHIYSEVCNDNKYNKIYDNLSTYTHPSFQNSNGFWVSKFLISENNRSIPDAKMVKKNLYEAIDISNNIVSNKTHLLTNMEYGSIVILSNSSYGKSGNSNYYTDDNYTFKRIYNNNYLYDITGCSSDYNNFSKSFITSTSKTCISYNDLTNYSHVANGVKYNVYEIGPGASTTGTIYGVYDMANIYGELTSAFISDENGLIDIDIKYYDLYSYNNYIGNIQSSNTAINLYRYKLGDAIKENFRTLSLNGMWQGGSLSQNTSSGIIIRGGNGDIKNASIYTASIVDYEYKAPFRVSLFN